MRESASGFVRLPYAVLPGRDDYKKMSADTMKISDDFSENSFTEMHTDNYSDSRVQAVLAYEAMVSLFYVPGNTLPRDQAHATGSWGHLLKHTDCDQGARPEGHPLQRRNPPQGGGVTYVYCTHCACARDVK